MLIVVFFHVQCAGPIFERITTFFANIGWQENSSEDLASKSDDYAKKMCWRGRAYPHTLLDHSLATRVYTVIIHQDN